MTPIEIEVFEALRPQAIRVEETETAAALAKADAYLSTQPTERNVAALEHAHSAHIQVSRRKAR